MERPMLVAFLVLGTACSLIVDPITAETGPTASCANDGPNGILEDDEQCDDGNIENTDACLNNCRLAICGDGVVRSYIESCDDPEDAGCSEDCIACPTDTDVVTMVGDRCYAYYTRDLSWGSARGSCFDGGGDLATLDDHLPPAGATAELLSALATANGGPLGGDPWFGLAHSAGGIEWVDESDGPASPNWESGVTFEEPSDVGVFRLSSGEWYLDAFDNPKPSICMRRPLLGFGDQDTGHYYYYQRRTLAKFGSGIQSAAEDACRRRGGHLATITSIEELDFLTETFTGRPNAWIGLRDIGGDGDLDWMTGEEFDPALIPGGSGLNTGQCVIFSDGALQSVGCNNNAPFSLCEWD